MVTHDDAASIEAAQYAHCPNCGQTKPLSEFGKDKNLPSGRTLWCRVCRNARQNRHRAERAVRPGGKSSADSKRCPRCGVLKHLSEFGADPARRLGVKSWCNQCFLEKQRADYNPAAAQKRSKNYRDRNPDKVKAANDRRKDNPEKARAQNKKSKDKNRVAILAKNRAYYAANAKEMVARTLAWQLANPEKARANVLHQNKMRKARKRGATGKMTLKEWRAILDYFDHRCAYCLGHEDDVGRLEQDHMLPICRGGSLNAENVVPACRSCNASKLHRTPLEFLARQCGFTGF